MSVSDRLKEYCKNNNISQDSLVKQGFGSKQTINNYMNGNTSPKSDFLENFIKKYRPPLLWFMTGEKSKYLNEVKLDSVGEKITIYSCPDCIEKQKEINLLNTELKEMNKKYIATLESLNSAASSRDCG